MLGYKDKDEDRGDRGDDRDDRDERDDRDGRDEDKLGSTVDGWMIAVGLSSCYL